MSPKSYKLFFILFTFCSAAVSNLVAQQQWSLTTLVNFNGTNGSHPRSSLILDANGSGTVYGTTLTGGSGTCTADGFSGCGTAFSLANPTLPNPTLTSYSFQGTTDGANPSAALVQGGKGYGTDFFGTTGAGGALDYGTVFQITFSTNGTAQLVSEYSFCSSKYCDDGANPAGALVFAVPHYLYGTTYISNIATSSDRDSKKNPIRSNPSDGTLFESIYSTNSSTRFIGSAAKNSAPTEVARVAVIPRQAWYLEVERPTTARLPQKE